MSERGEGEKECPFCAETIKAKAIKCKHCGEMLAQTCAPRPLTEREVETPSALSSGETAGGAGCMKTLAVLSSAGALLSMFGSNALGLIFFGVMAACFFFFGSLLAETGAEPQDDDSAEPPIDIPAAITDETSSPDAGKPFYARTVSGDLTVTVLAFVVVAIPLGHLVYTRISDALSGSSYARESAPIQSTKTGQNSYRLSGPTFLGTSKDALSFATSTNRASAASSRGDLILLPSGTTVAVLDRGFATSRVVVTDGLHANSEGYIASEFVR